MITIVFWAFYAGVCLGAAIVGWCSAEQDGLSTVPRGVVAVVYAALAPVYIGVVVSGLIIGHMRGLELRP